MFLLFIFICVSRKKQLDLEVTIDSWKSIFSLLKLLKLKCICQIYIYKMSKISHHIENPKWRGKILMSHHTAIETLNLYQR